MKASYKKLWKLLVDKDGKWTIIKHHDQAEKRRGCFDGSSS